LKHEKIVFFLVFFVGFPLGMLSLSWVLWVCVESGLWDLWFFWVCVGSGLWDLWVFWVCVGFEFGFFGFSGLVLGWG
jgi:hypothetical protein